MKKSLIFLLAAFIGCSCIAQQSADLERLKFDENPTIIINNYKKIIERADPVTSLPSYTTYDVAGFSFGSIP
jgi:hypothetical protein